jgi:hypothetical protein
MAEKGKRRAGGEVLQGRWHGCCEGLGGTRSGAVFARVRRGEVGSTKEEVRGMGEARKGVGASVEEVELEG